MLDMLASFHDESLSGMVDDKELTAEEIRRYHAAKNSFLLSLRRSLPELEKEAPATIRMTVSALNMLPDAFSGKSRPDVFSSKVAWMGGEAKASGPGRIALVLSGGVARGVFYIGFLKALEEAGFWPDVLVATSAGALGAAAMASGKGISSMESHFSAGKMRRIFSPLLAPYALIRSRGRGIIGYGFGEHLHKAFGEARFSDSADLFVVSSVQQDFNFGKTLIGRSSTGRMALSSDIKVFEGVWGSSAMQGIIPQPELKHFTAERLSWDVRGLGTDSLEMECATLDDGGVVENLPVPSAEMIMEALGGPYLMIAVNLMDLNPMNAFGGLGLISSAGVSPPEGGLEVHAKASPAPGHIFRRGSIFGKSALMRGFLGLEHAFYENMIQSVEMSSGTGMKIILNPNSDGSLEGIDLVTMRGYDSVREYGYSMGKRLVDRLLGP